MSLSILNSLIFFLPNLILWCCDRTLAKTSLRRKGIILFYWLQYSLSPRKDKAWMKLEAGAEEETIEEYSLIVYSARLHQPGLNNQEPPAQGSHSPWWTLGPPT